MCDVFIIDPDKMIKLMPIYPTWSGRDYQESRRVIGSLQLGAKHHVSISADRKQGEGVILGGAISDDEVEKLYPKVEIAGVAHSVAAATEIVAVRTKAQIGKVRWPLVGDWHSSMKEIRRAWQMSDPRRHIPSLFESSSSVQSSGCIGGPANKAQEIYGLLQ